MIKRKYLALALAAVVGIVLISCVQTDKQQTAVQAKAKKCVECHPEMQDLFTQGYIHEPVKQQECSACHLPHGLIGGLFFRQEQPELCYTCHQDIRVKQEDKSSHDPMGKGRCDSCHTPHNSTYPSLLKKQTEETCYSCHDRQEFQKKFVHAPMDKGCMTCHDPHRSADTALLKQEADALCRSCHQVDSKNFTSAHNGYPVDKGCLQCHSPHSANRPSLLKETLHRPVEQKKCDSCHRVEGKKILTRKNTNALCLDCHDTPAGGAMSSHKPYLDKKCSTCHVPHASNEVSLLTSAPGLLCKQCHSSQSLILPGAEKETPPAAAAPVEGETSIPVLSSHKPVTEGKCLKCHAGHTSANKALLLQSEEKTCTACHSAADFTGSGSSHPAAAKKSCNTCHQPHASPNSVLLKDTQETLCFSCHKREGNERGRFSLHQPFATGACTGCHSLHKAKEKKFLKSKLSNGSLCAGCHDAVVNPAENIRPHAPVSKGNCTRCHDPHAADYPFVMRKKSGEICLGCHKDVSGQITGSTTPHQPAVDRECTSCHAAHGSPHDNILKKGQPMLCLTCHKEVAQYCREGTVHKPAVKNCMQCHVAHGSNEKGMTIAGTAKLCSQCHETDTAAFNTAHKNITPGKDSCVQCHDAHGSPGKGLLYPVGHTPFLEGNCTPCHEGRGK